MAAPCPRTQRGRWRPPLAGLLGSLLALAVAEEEDWVAYDGALELGPPGRNGSGWQRLALAGGFEGQAWELPGRPNGYRCHHPRATHYLLGAGAELVEVWQPFGETPWDGSVGANIRAALYTLYRASLARYQIKLTNANWSGVASAPICRPGAPCPNVILLGDTQVPARVRAQNTRPLNDLFDAYLQENMRRLPDDFPNLALYQYHFEQAWVAIPLITDLRLLRFNKTTLDALGEPLPPPHGHEGDPEWTWARLADLACKVALRHGDGTGLSMSSDWDEDYKYAMMMAQSSGAYLFNRSAGGERRCNLDTPGFVGVVEDFWKRVLRENCAAARDGAALRTYWAGVSPASEAFNATLGRIDPAFPPEQGPLSRYVDDAEEGSAGSDAPLPGFAFTTGLAQRPGRGELLYADMPGRFTYLGGSGLILPVAAEEGSTNCSGSGGGGGTSTGRGARADAVGGDSARCGAERRRVAQGWRIMTELADREKPWILQVNTMKGGRTLPPVASLISRRPFATPGSIWEPAVRALSRAIPSQYPNPPMPEAADVERKKPLRILLLRAVYGNASAREAIGEGCAVLEDILRPCNKSDWEEDPRCDNPLDDQRGCKPGEYLVEGGWEPNGQTCSPCPAGTFQEGRDVRPECTECSAGTFAGAPGATGCSACDTGKAATRAGMSRCETCERGAVGLDHSVCRPCWDGYYLRGDQCERCPAGRTSKGGSDSENDCYVTNAVYAYNLLLFPVVLCLVLAIPAVAGRRVPIHDVYTEDGFVVVRSWTLHHVLRRPMAVVRVTLRDTGHPMLDGRKAPFRAAFKSSRSLWLLDEGGRRVEASAESSMGSLQVCFPDCLLCSGLGVVPIGAIAFGLLAAMAALVSVLVALRAAEAELSYISAALLGGLATATAAASFYTWRCSFASAPLAQRRDEFRRKLHFANPRPRPCPRGPGRAVAAGKLWDFYETFLDFVRTRDMYYVGANLLLPLTQPEQLSYAELAGPSAVQWFVSHFWGMAFRDFVASLRKHAEGEGGAGVAWQSTSFWVCSFSNNQWNVKAELGLGDPLDSSFYLALRSEGCKGTAMVLDHLAMPLTRSWCLFEVFQTCLLSGQRQDFGGLLLCTPAGVLQRGGTGVDAAVVVAHKLSTISLEDATATDIEDKRMIDDCVRQMPGGFPAMDRFVRECIKRALQAVHGSFQQDFASLVAALDDVPGQPAAEFDRASREFLREQRPRLLGRRTTGPPRGSKEEGEEQVQQQQGREPTGGSSQGEPAAHHSDDLDV